MLLLGAVTFACSTSGVAPPATAGADPTTATTGSPDEYDLLRPEFAADFLDFLLPWLAEQVGGR